MTDPHAEHFTANDFACRLLAILFLVGLVVVYIAVGIALYPVMDERLGSWFTVICFVAGMAIIGNLLIPGWSVVASLWLKGTPGTRTKAAAESARQRSQLELMTARSRQMYGEDGPPESQNGDVSKDRYAGRDVGSRRAKGKG